MKLQCFKCGGKHEPTNDYKCPYDGHISLTHVEAMALLFALKLTKRLTLDFERRDLIDKLITRFEDLRI